MELISLTWYFQKLGFRGGHIQIPFTFLSSFILRFEPADPMCHYVGARRAVGWALGEPSAVRHICTSESRWQWRVVLIPIILTLSPEPYWNRSTRKPHKPRLLTLKLYWIFAILFYSATDSQTDYLKRNLWQSYNTKTTIPQLRNKSSESWIMKQQLWNKNSWP